LTKKIIFVSISGMLNGEHIINLIYHMRLI